jgi:hypothetical protein
MKQIYITTQVPDTLHKAVKKAAKDRGIKLAFAYRLAIEAWLKQQDKPEAAV